MEEKNFLWKKWLIAFLFGVALITVYKTFDNIHHVFSALGSFFSLLTPFYIGFLLAFFLYPVTKRLEKKFESSRREFLKKRKKGLSISIVYVSFLLLLVVAISVLLPKLSVSITDFLKGIPDYMKQLEEFLRDLVSENGLLASFSLENEFNNLNFQKLLSDMLLQDVWGYVAGVKNVTGVFFDWLMGIVICGYTLVERDSLFKILRRICGLFLKNETMDKFGDYTHRISYIFYKFFFGKAVDSLIVGILAIIGFNLLGIPFASVLGLIVMVFNMIPYFGPFIGAVPAVLVALLTKNVYSALWTALFILALQQFDGLWLGPKILGGTVGISPFWVIFAIVVVGGMFGVPGMIFGVPLVAAVRMLAGDYLDDGKLNFSTDKEKTGEPEETE